MLKTSKTVIFWGIQARVCYSNKSIVDLVSVPNVQRKKSYRFEPHMKSILQKLRTLLTCTESKAYSIYDQYPSIRSIDNMDIVRKNIEILTKNGISSQTIIDNPFLIVMNEGGYWNSFMRYYSNRFNAVLYHNIFVSFQVRCKQSWISY